MKTLRTTPLDFWPQAKERLLSPRFRGRFSREDASQFKAGWLSVGNEEGRIYAIVHPESQGIEATRFLSYGECQSVPILDVFCESSKGKNVEEWLKVSNQSLARELEIEEDLEIWSKERWAFIEDLKKQIRKEVPHLKVEESPDEKDQVYRRKDKKEMSEIDLAWLPLSAPQKLLKLEKAIQECLKSRTSIDVEQVEVFSIQRDLEVQLKFSESIEQTQRPTLVQFINEHIQQELHPEIRCEAVS